MKGKFKKSKSRAEIVIEEAKSTKIFDGNSAIEEVEKLVRKYQSNDDDLYAPHRLGDLQKDAVRLMAFNYTLSGMAANLRGRASRKKNIRKLAEAQAWINARRKSDEELIQGMKSYLAMSKKLPKPQRKTDGMLEAECLLACRDEMRKEVNAEEDAARMESAVQATVELVNVIKKVIDRLMAELHLQGSR